jgi:hypothetical protein
MEHQARLGRALKQLLLASYGLYPADLARELADAARHLGGAEVALLLSDYDQQVLVGFDVDDPTTYAIDADGPGEAFRHEVVIEEHRPDGRRRLWMPVKDSADRLGVMGVVDDGSVPLDDWEAIASLVGELVVSKAGYGDHITRRKRSAPFLLAAEMRWGLLPPLTFTGPDVTIAGFLQPSHGIAGDAFDYSVTQGTAEVGIFDAMGHGMEASRMANVAVASYRNSRRGGADPVQALLALDEIIAEEFGEARFVTAQTASLDLATGQMEVANAGHPRPLLLRAGSPPEEVPCEPSPPAGLHSRPTSVVIQLDEGDSVLFRTDGIVDARSPTGDVFGDERLVGLLRELGDAGLPASEVLRRSVRATIEHQAGREGDDATLLMVAWKPIHPPRPVSAEGPRP